MQHDEHFARRLLHAQLGQAPEPRPASEPAAQAAGTAEPEPAERHRAEAPTGIGCAVVTVSDTRRRATDRGGDAAVAALERWGHEVRRRALVPDVPAAIAHALREALADARVDAVLFTGGTGLGPRDVTPEVLERRYDKPLPGFGEAFRRHSEAQIGAAAMLSRASAGIAAGKPVFCLPGSPKAVALACERLIGPELGHLLRVLERGRVRAAAAGGGEATA
ncbi:MAG: molybdenum cofactor biosynthesis protein MoaB [Planctomycetota bacterium]|nr:MAG: molybdenum cofactor biosynthesis protein MoaB [Planctomycetota bacterium]